MSVQEDEETKEIADNFSSNERAKQRRVSFCAVWFVQMLAGRLSTLTYSSLE